MNILALDLAKQVGHAAYLDGQIESGTRPFAPFTGQPIGALFSKWDTWIEWKLRENDIDFVAYELIDWNIINRDWRQIYMGMKAILMSNAYRLRIDARGYVVRDIKRAATGKAKAEKPDMIRTARARWPDQTIIDDNQADALWVMYLACKTKGIDMGKHPEELFEL